MVNSMCEQNEDPDSGSVFTFGKSKFGGNLPGMFWIKNDPVLQVACGDEHSAIVTASGRVFCFGSNEWGQLGLGHNNPISKPTLVKGLKHERVTLIACGRSHTLVATDTGFVYGFGANGEGQLGLSHTKDYCFEPQALEKFSATGIKSLSAGAEHSLAVTDRGQIFAWGSNSEGQLGLFDKTQFTVPTELKLETSAICVSAGYYHSSVVTDDGKLYTFGESEGGKLGLPEHLKKKSSRPQQVPGITGKIVWVSCGGNHTVVVTADGRVYSFGDGSSGQLGLGTQFLETPVPERVILPKNCRVARVSCGENHTALLTDSGQLYMCGDGRHGKLGSENLDACANQFLPTLVTQFDHHQVQQVCCGGLHTLVLAAKKPGADKNGHTVLASVEFHRADLKLSARERRRRLREKSKNAVSQHLKNGADVENGNVNEPSVPIPLCSDEEDEEKRNDGEDEVQSISLPSTLVRKRGSILQEAEKDTTIRHADSDLDLTTSEPETQINQAKELSAFHYPKEEDEEEIVTESLQIIDTPEELEEFQKPATTNLAPDSPDNANKETKGPFRFSKLFSKRKQEGTATQECLSANIISGSPKEQMHASRTLLKDTKKSNQDGDKQSKTCTIL